MMSLLQDMYRGCGCNKLIMYNNFSCRETSSRGPDYPRGSSLPVEIVSKDETCELLLSNKRYIHLWPRHLSLRGHKYTLVLLKCYSQLAQLPADETDQHERGDESAGHGVGLS